MLLAPEVLQRQSQPKGIAPRHVADLRIVTPPGNAELQAFILIGDADAVADRVKPVGKAQQIVIVGFDGQPEGKQAIKDGKIYADPIQFPDRMGVEVVQAIIAHSKGQDVPAETLIPTKLYRKADAEQDANLK